MANEIVLIFFWTVAIVVNVADEQSIWQHGFDELAHLS